MNQRDKTQIRKALDDSARDIDGATLARLHQARNRALEAARRPSIWQRIPVIPTAAIGTVGAAALALMVWISTPVPPSLETVQDPTDVELLAAGEELELYDDLEFLMWLSEQDLDVG